MLLRQTKTIATARARTSGKRQIPLRIKLFSPLACCLLPVACYITAAIALSVGGSLAIAKPPERANFPLLTSPPQSVAQETRQPRHQQLQQRGFPGGRLMEQLNLSKEQKQQISTIRQKYQRQTQQLREEIRSERQKLQDMMAGTATEAEIRRQHPQVAQLNQTIHNLHFEGMLQTRQVLTPEQRRQFAQLMQQRRGQSRPPSFPPSQKDN